MRGISVGDHIKVISYVGVEVYGVVEGMCEATWADHPAGPHPRLTVRYTCKHYEMNGKLLYVYGPKDRRDNLALIEVRRVDGRLSCRNNHLIKGGCK